MYSAMNHHQCMEPVTDSRLGARGCWECANICCLNCAWLHKDPQDCCSQLKIFLKQNSTLCQELCSQKQKMTVISVLFFHHSKEKHAFVLFRKGLEFLLKSNFFMMQACNYDFAHFQTQIQGWRDDSVVTLPDDPDPQHPQGSWQLSIAGLGIPHPLFFSTDTAHGWCTDRREDKILIYIK